MSALAPTVQAFFTQRLIAERNASPNTIAAYRDTIRLLLAFAATRCGREPSMLDIADLDATTVAAFLDHLQTQRGNSARTRNARLAAIHSLYRYAALRHPEHAHDIQRVLSIPPKRTDRALVTFLDEAEIDALLAAPDRATWTGRRDHALLMLAIQTGLRASELTTPQHRRRSTRRRRARHLPGQRPKTTHHAAHPSDRRRPARVARRTRRQPERSAVPNDPRPATQPRRARTPPRDPHRTQAAQHQPTLDEERHACTRSGTPPRCNSFTPGSTPPSSPSGSVTNGSRQPRSTSTPTSPSKRKRSPGPNRPTPSQAATGPPTRSSRSSKRSDYADPNQPKPPTTTSTATQSA